MYVHVFLISVGHYVQHTPGYHDSVDGRHAERSEFLRCPGDIHEHRRRG